MKILAIETSCDDTGMAVLQVKDGKFKVLSNIVSSQEIHKNYGGVFPMMAKREHQINLIPVLEKALKEANLLVEKKEVIIAESPIMKKILSKEEELYKKINNFLEKYEKPFDYAQGKPAIDAIAVTHGPGLEPCLWVGVNFARALSYFWEIPLVPVNHIEAHILVNFLDNKEIKFPAISLVASGGHTQLILMRKIGDYKIIGETRDDAAGECFDKCAKILGLDYPGGPEISRIAAKYKSQTSNTEYQLKLPRPMMSSKDYDFSFSGLKTAVLYVIKGKTLTERYIGYICVEIQQAIVDVLFKKTMQAAKDFDAKTIILGGGVSANNELRLRFEVEASKLEVPVIFPEKNLSTDNALMIAVAGYFHKNKKASPSKISGQAWKTMEADANLRISS